MQCNALRKNGHPCRNYATPTEDGGAVCHMHKDFFTSDKAFENLKRNASIFQSIPERKWAIRMLKSAGFKWQLPYTAYIEAATDSVEPFEKDKAAYIYDIAIRAEVIRPLSILKVWRSRVRRQIDVLLFCSSTSNEPTSPFVIGELLNPYFTEMDAYMGFTLVSHILRTLGLPDIAPQATVDLYKSVWQNILGVVAARCSMDYFIGYPIEKFMEHLDSSHVKYRTSLWHKGLREHVEKIIREGRTVLRKEMKARCNVFKEELVSVVFRPENVMHRWELGCLPEDM